MLFAACGFLVAGIGDLLIDIVWLVRSAVRHFTVYRRTDRCTAATLASPEQGGTLAIFIPVWDEAEVIGPMLTNMAKTWGAGNWLAFVGQYINDPATRAAVMRVPSPNILSIVGDTKGPTTKADCLNLLWRALLAEEAMLGTRFKAIVLHDAEDVVHADELRVFDTLIERFALVQLPVLPLVDVKSRWVGGHYLDEFAESHGKTLVVREALGAALPSAGVGCALSRSAMQDLADQNANRPFHDDSLTEDYELGLRVRANGGRGAFVRMADRSGGAPVAVRAHFPATLDAAVRQKARWTVGIALSGWDRLGWDGGIIEHWMRLHDRSALLAALVLTAAYVSGVGLIVLAVIGAAAGLPPRPLPPSLETILDICLVLLVWRLIMRAVLVTRAYGWVEGLSSIPRVFVSNFIAILAAKRAVALYLTARRQGKVSWDKTAHRFPNMTAP